MTGASASRASINENYCRYTELMTLNANSEFSMANESLLVTLLDGFNTQFLSQKTESFEKFTSSLNQRKSIGGDPVAEYALHAGKLNLPWTHRLSCSLRDWTVSIFSKWKLWPHLWHAASERYYQYSNETHKHLHSGLCCGSLALQTGQRFSTWHWPDRACGLHGDGQTEFSISHTTDLLTWEDLLS